MNCLTSIQNVVLFIAKAACCRLSQSILIVTLAIHQNSFAQSQHDRLEQAIKETKSISFYYNKVEDLNDLVNFDRVVLAPHLVSNRQIQTIKQSDTLVFAYLSVGEFGTETLPDDLSDDVLLINEAWQSKVMDLGADDWQSHLYTRASALLKRGFDGIFLDTLDSYQLLPKAIADSALQQQHLLGIINTIQLLPAPSNEQPKLILNRGFDLVSKLSTKPYAVVAESMHHAYLPLNDSYSKVKDSDSLWLENTLNKIKALGIEAIVIDYVPASAKPAQIEAAKTLLNKGYTPYISDGMLYEVGVSTIIPTARKVLGFYNSQRETKRASSCHRMLSMPIEYFGYIPQCYDISTFDFKKVDLNLYAAVTFWLEVDDYQKFPDIEQLIQRAYNNVPMLFLGGFPDSPKIQALLGIEERGLINAPLSQVKGQQWTDSFKKAHFSHFEPSDSWSNTKKENQAEVIFEDANATQTAYVFTSTWGGAALRPFPVRLLATEKDEWLLDPFKLIQKTLKLPAIPVIDATTESGRRILLSYVDGDGFPSKSSFIGNPYTAEVLRDKVFSRYKMPHTISVIQGEIYSGGMHTQESKTLENIARSIFELPNVELASHSYSHPFFWRKTKVEDSLYGLHLDIEGYELDYNKEIVGSIDYINTSLAPEGKKAKLILWTGLANPTEEILAIAEQNNLGNINGASTYVVNGNQPLTQVYPTIVWYPKAVQVYAPIINENLYTNLWTEHYDGFSRVIETFDLLESPRRLKPISIYYHMYSGQYPVSVKALESIYEWAFTQSIHPMYLSEYVDRANVLYDSGVAKTLTGQWQISSRSIKNVRLPHELGFPNTKQVVGFNEEQDGKYVSLLNKKSVFETQKTIPHGSYMQSANGKVLNWQLEGSSITWTIASHVPLELIIQIGKEQQVESCEVDATMPVSLTKTAANLLIIKSKFSGELSGKVICQDATAAKSGVSS